MAIDPVLDMMRTATNVAGQALVPVIVSARENILDRKAFDSVHLSPVGDDYDVREAEQKVTVSAAA